MKWGYLILALMFGLPIAFFAWVGVCLIWTVLHPQPMMMFPSSSSASLDNTPGVVACLVLVAAFAIGSQLDHSDDVK